MGDPESFQPMAQAYSSGLTGMRTFSRPSVNIPSPAGIAPASATPTYGSNPYSPSAGLGAGPYSASAYVSSVAGSPYLRPCSASSLSSAGAYMSPAAAKPSSQERLFKQTTSGLRDSNSPKGSLSPGTPRGDYTVSESGIGKPPASPSTYVSPRIGAMYSPEAADVQFPARRPYSPSERRKTMSDDINYMIRGELRETEAQLQETIQDLQRSKQEMEELQEARRKAREELAEMAEQNKKLLASYTEKKQELRKMEEANIAARGEAQKFAEENQMLAAAVKAAQDEMAGLKLQSASDSASRDRLKGLKEECDELRMVNFRQAKDIDALNAKVEELHGKLRFMRCEGSHPRSPVDRAKLQRFKTPKTLKIENLSNQNSALKEENEMIKRMNEEIMERSARRERAEGYKQAGTVSFQKIDYKEALKQYSKAIEEEVEDPKFNALLYCNRAACQMAMKDYLSCISDCSTAAAMDSSLPRTYHRRAEAYQAIGDYSNAYNDMVILKDRLGKGDDVCSLMDSLRTKANAQTPVNHYLVLGVPTDASERDIKKAYKMLALIHHPDKVAQAEQPGAECVFKMLSDALRVLTSEDARKRVDASLGVTSS
eukprot:CAMPEP_0117684724 /NCGR_PEP_ID=MMETSP0804-20121206/21283_1 /TAXON_ID=1074897 /ORGANISM="Tetraselmis astigmatica, Strain CCMP880" /LENGTH=599 /DNA_ID=CAMNT_0005495797 /DNA_START=245 /DNA_END=2044 /DNA_ORIENTATION=+